MKEDSKCLPALDLGIQRMKDGCGGRGTTANSAAESCCTDLPIGDLNVSCDRATTRWQDLPNKDILNRVNGSIAIPR
jgi:hypothetical protein